MKNLSILALMLIIGTSCQHSKSISSNNNVERNLANSSRMRIFLQEISRRLETTTTQKLEQEAIEYIKRFNGSKGAGNWEQIGITEKQAKSIKSLYDDAPHMAKVRKWVRNNITKISRVEESTARKAYDAIMRGQKGYINPYKFHADGAVGMVSRRRKSLNPFNSVTEHQQRVAHSIQQLGLARSGLSSSAKRQIASLQRRYKEAMVVILRRGKRSTSIFANGNEIIESACKVTQKTGHPGMGTGCKEFNENAAEVILANKADIDQVRSQIIEQRAYDKAGKVFDSFDEIPASKRLTPSEIDDATVEAFKRVNGMTDDEARIAVKRLKQSPCKVY